MAARETAAKPPSKNSNSKPGKKSAQVRKNPPRPTVRPISWRWILPLGAELCALVVACLIGTIAALGRAAEWFAGTGLAESLLPFAGTVLVLALAGSALVQGWLWLRVLLARKAALLPMGVALVIAAGAGAFAAQDVFRHELASLRTLVGGTVEAERVTISHQVFAAYRRSDLAQTQRIIDRAQSYLPVIRRAAEANQVDREVLVGIGAAESSFLPRDSKDGGRGLFQITVPPKEAVDAVKKQLGTDKPDPLNQTHNAFLAAATLRHYLDEMQDDLFLALLAYNIGPKNGGLRSIMSQYGARDFVTIQPYLKDLPRDYPIRVLTGALAYRLWRADGKLSRYEEGRNARRIQKVGIPGLDEDGGTARASRNQG
jgi:hypothetical protein